jgi:cytochrome c oxidase subunit 2
MGHATIEWVYVGVVVALLIYVGADAWNIERELEHVPPEAKIIKVIGAQWFWTFEHEDGTREVRELHLVRGQPYKFEITSTDVIHAFNVPDFTLMLDAVPGKINTLWVVPDQSGEYLIQCREYCGFSHYQMRATLYVEEPSDVEQVAADLNQTKGALAVTS